MDEEETIEGVKVAEEVEECRKEEVEAESPSVLCFRVLGRILVE